MLVSLDRGWILVQRSAKPKNSEFKRLCVKDEVQSKKYIKGRRLLLT